MIEWVWPWMFLLMPVPLAVRLLLPSAERQQAALMVPNVAAFQVPGAAGTELAGRRVPWRIILLSLAWIALVTASARPQWTGESVTLPTAGRDLMLAVDISGSMGTEDMQLGNNLVDRLVVVKRVVASFVEARDGDRVGLILFGTNAYLQAPLTFDLASVNQLLVEAPVGIAGGKTAIGDAIGLAIKRMRLRPEGDRVLVLLTDGANNVGEVAPIKAAELAAEENIRIYTIGVGANELRMPSIFGSLGSRIINPSSELDEETLSAIASKTNGRYFRAQNTEKLVEIYQLIDEMEPIEQEPETYRPIAALYRWPLTLCWLAVMWLLVLDWRGGTLSGPPSPGGAS
ncbi:MAG: VWA domain-containing protein [Pseudomonadales bacterium]|jgi:Ca-activated chloride channel family protein|nr:VWA domain-containing protein [Pseudomonadales bacterium]MDP6471333.1 VWA domain-containing protein [Pseudomonadales bacterium]MDP6826476.1 VWA domain-containing protein [Pseudomonadales bacterium]MDP6970069.1 VWA domain-containing protein [Pseudomonadales bacterium]|tara:strand:+ start:1023 stop:2054 length:1032 start_codon:yes stop_codon:yes gene_type:complete